MLLSRTTVLKLNLEAIISLAKLFVKFEGMN